MSHFIAARLSDGLESPDACVLRADIPPVRNMNAIAPDASQPDKAAA